MGLSRARFIEVPLGLVHAVATITEQMQQTVLSRESLDMLSRGNTGDARPLQQLLAHQATLPEHFIGAPEAALVRVAAQVNWLVPLLRLSVALVWIFTGIVSLGLYSTQSSYSLLARVGVSDGLATILLYGAATIDLALGVATLLVNRGRLLWILQGTLIILYTVIISVRLPEFWLHPFGPLIKNLPMLAAIVALYYLERR